MPIYDYECSLCGIRTDISAGIEDAIIPCHSCGGNSRRVPVYQSQGVVYKGSGFTKMAEVPKNEPEEVNHLIKKAAGKSGVTYEHTLETMHKARRKDEGTDMTVLNGNKLDKQRIDP